MEYLWAFLIGGALCAVAQIIIDKTRMTPARVLVSYVVAGAVLTAAGVYGPFVEFAKCGATVPLTGFGYSLITGVQDAINKYGLTGIITGGLTGTAGGISAAVVFSLIASLIFKSKEK